MIRRGISAATLLAAFACIASFAQSDLSTITGVVKSPVVRVGSTTRPLTLRLTGIVIHGHSVPIKTDDLEMDDTSPWTVGRRGIQVTGSAYMISSGAVLQFRLKAPAEV